MKAKEIMTESPACCASNDSIERAAKLMEEHDCGCIPVVDDTGGRAVVGVITDRDLAVRAVGHGLGSDTIVSDLMTATPVCCSPDAELREVEDMMSDRQIRRLVVVDEAGRCIGMVAQADLARAAEERRGLSDADVGRVVEKISEPSREPLWHL